MRATIIVNSANIIPLGGVTTGELSDLYGNLFTPAGYMFSIYGVICLILAVFSYYLKARALKVGEELVNVFLGVVEVAADPHVSSMRLSPCHLDLLCLQLGCQR